MIHFSLYGVGNGSHPVAELTEISMDSRISFSSVIQIEEEYWDIFISSFCGNMGRKSDRLYCITFDYISFSGCQNTIGTLLLSVHVERCFRQNAEHPLPCSATGEKKNLLCVLAWMQSLYTPYPVDSVQVFPHTELPYPTDRLWLKWAPQGWGDLYPDFAVQETITPRCYVISRHRAFSSYFYKYLVKACSSIQL